MAKYGKKASEKVKKVMHERKAGTLKSGSTGKKVKSRKQGIAIGLSEARRAGAKVPQIIVEVEAESATAGERLERWGISRWVAFALVPPLDGKRDAPPPSDHTSANQPVCLGMGFRNWPAWREVLKLVTSRWRSTWILWNITEDWRQQYATLNQECNTLKQDANVYEQCQKYAASVKDKIAGMAEEGADATQGSQRGG